MSMKEKQAKELRVKVAQRQEEKVWDRLITVEWMETGHHRKKMLPSQLFRSKPSSFLGKWL